MGVLDLLDESCRFPKVRQPGWGVGGRSGGCLWVPARWQRSRPCFASCQNPLATGVLVCTPPCSLSQATHKDFATKLYGAPSIKDSRRFSKPKLSRTDFTIEHYAGGCAVQRVCSGRVVLGDGRGRWGQRSQRRASSVCFTHALCHKPCR